MGLTFQNPAVIPYFGLGKPRTDRRRGPASGGRPEQSKAYNRATWLNEKPIGNCGVRFIADASQVLTIEIISGIRPGCGFVQLASELSAVDERGCHGRAAE